MDRDAGRAHDDIARGKLIERLGGHRPLAPTEHRAAAASSRPRAARRRPPPRCSRAAACARPARRTRRSRGRRPRRRSARLQAPRTARTSVQQPRRDVVLAAEREHGRRVARGQRVRRQHLGRQPSHDRVSAPALVAGQQPHRGERLLLLADALERLVAAAGGEQREALVLALVGQQVSAEDRRQVRGLAERREREEHEAALRAVPAPGGGAQRGVDPEDRVAAGEGAVVALHAGEGARDRELGGRPQHRELTLTGALELGERRATAGARRAGPC